MYVCVLKIILASKPRLSWVARKLEWITDTSISVEACPGDAKCRPTARSVLVCRVERKCSLNRSPRHRPVSPMYTLLQLVADVYHVAACTGVLGIDGDTPPRSIDRR